jgi:hypothetical protein
MSDSVVNKGTDGSEAVRGTPLTGCGLQMIPEPTNPLFASFDVRKAVRASQLDRKVGFL